MKARKTVSITALVDRANDMLSKSAQQMKDGRIAICIMLESILMDAGAYRGFQFTDGNNGRTDDTLRAYYGGAS